MLILLASALCSWADVDPSRFSDIVDRNPFRLKDPPQPTEMTNTAPPPVPIPLATVKLTGITGAGILGTPRALLEIIPGPGKQMLKPVLSEGEKVESVEVVSISVDKNEVVVKNGTLVTNLTFEIAKSTPTPTPGTPGTVGTPGIPGRPVVPPTFPGAPQANAGQPSYNYSPAAGNRSGVIMTGGSVPAYETSAGVQPGGTMGTPVQNNLNNNSGFRSIPSRSIRSPGLPPQPNATPQMSAEASVIEVERNRQVNPAHLPPLPPTVLTPHLPPLPGQQ